LLEKRRGNGEEGQGKKIGASSGQFLHAMRRGEWGFVVGVGSREKEREGTVGEDDSDMWAMLGSEREGERGFPGWCWAG
jgi:hypothetical protein